MKHKKKHTYYSIFIILFGILFNIQKIEANGAMISKDIYHQHIGSESSGGGCYTKEHTKTETVEQKCQGTLIYYPSYGTTGCGTCGAGYTGDQSGRDCYTVTSYTNTITYYTLDCNIQGYVGALFLQKSTDEWTRQLELYGWFVNGGNLYINHKPYIWNGSTVTDQNNWLVEQNGLYSLKLNTDLNNITEEAILNIVVDNIDRTPPTVINTYKNEEEWTKENIIFSFQDVQDLQENGTIGSGLHTTPFLFSGNTNWTDNNSIEIIENGEYITYIKDRLENVMEYRYRISNIDREGPTFLNIEIEEEKNAKDCTIIVEIEDLQLDGSLGSGLPKHFISYDEGKTWDDELSITVSENKEYSVYIKDKLENISKKNITISHLDTYGPTVSHTKKLEESSNQREVIELHVEDINKDGTKGIGLPKYYLSTDLGKTWSDQNIIEHDENNTYIIWAKDLNDNITTYTYSVDSIKSIENLEPDELEEEEEKKCITETRKEENKEIGLEVIPEESIMINSNQEEVKKEPVQEEGMEEPIQDEEIIEPFPVKSTEVEEQKKEKNYIFIVTFGIGSIIVSLMLFIILTYFTVGVYNKDEKGEYIFLGKEWIKKEEGRTKVTIAERLVNVSYTNCYRMKLSKLYLLRHKQEELLVIFGEKNISVVTIDDNIEVENCS